MATRCSSRRCVGSDIRSPGPVTVGIVRVLLVAETFTPAVNGVVNSVRQVADQLAARGHEPIVVAPSGSTYRGATGHRIEVITVPSVTLPGYRGLSVARPSVDLAPVLDDVAPDVVHLASPVLLGWAAVQAAHQRGIGTVAVFQTDICAFAARYGLRMNAPLWAWLRRLHNTADLTLAPSSATAYQLRRHGIGPIAMWTRGVDRVLFDPDRRDAAWRAEFAAEGELLVGFVGRLAPEKRVELLEPIASMPGVRLVVVGDGPRRRSLQRLMPQAQFTGQLTGPDLGRAMASLDLLVHPGADETFCQVVQEALCAGVPVIAAAKGGPLDLVRHGDNGWLWAGDDPEVLAAQVAAVRDDPEGAAEVRGRARASVSARTWSRVTDQLIAHYHRVLAGSRRDAVARMRRPRGRVS